MKTRSNNNFYNKKLKSYAREHRNHSTLSEITLWSNLLRARQMKGYQFLRQRPIGKYIADFFCKDLKLIIELDGLTHESKESDDKARQISLERLGYSILRFSDAEIILNFEVVKFKLENWIENYEKSKIKQSSPYPPSKGE